jgi:hypothetical protein
LCSEYFCVVFTFQTSASVFMSYEFCLLLNIAWWLMDGLSLVRCYLLPWKMLWVAHTLPVSCSNLHFSDEAKMNYWCISFLPQQIVRISLANWRSIWWCRGRCLNWYGYMTDCSARDIWPTKCDLLCNIEHICQFRLGSVFRERWWNLWPLNVLLNIIKVFTSVFHTQCIIKYH